MTSNSEFILAIVFSSIALFSILNDFIFSRWFSVRDGQLSNSGGDKISRTDYQQVLAYFLSIISFLLGILLISQAGMDLALLDKSTLNAQYPLSQSFFLSMPAGVACVYGVYKKDKALIFLGLLPMILYVVIGFRSVAIVLIVAVLLLHSYQTRIVSRKSIRIAGITALIFISFVVYKQAYIPIKEGTFDFFETSVSKDNRFESTLDFLIWAAFSAEFGQVSSNLELSSRDDLSSYHSYSAVFLSSIPLLSASDMGVTTNPRFSDTIMEHANPGFSYGLGGTFWGENFVLGGFLGVIIAALTFGFIVLLLQFLIFKKRLFILLYLATNLVFLLPKMDVYAVLGIFKNGIILIAVPIFLIILILGLKSVLSDGVSYFDRRLP